MTPPLAIIGPRDSESSDHVIPSATELSDEDEDEDEDEDDEEEEDEEEEEEDETNSKSSEESIEAAPTTANTTEVTAETEQTCSPEEFDDETEIEEDDDETESESEENTDSDISVSINDNINDVQSSEEYKLEDFQLLKTIGKLEYFILYMNIYTLLYSLSSRKILLHFA